METDNMNLRNNKIEDDLQKTNTFPILKTYD